LPLEEEAGPAILEDIYGILLMLMLEYKCEGRLWTNEGDTLLAALGDVSRSFESMAINLCYNYNHLGMSSSNQQTLLHEVLSDLKHWFRANWKITIAYNLMALTAYSFGFWLQVRI